MNAPSTMRPGGRWRTLVLAFLVALCCGGIAYGQLPGLAGAPWTSGGRGADGAGEEEYRGTPLNGEPAPDFRLVDQTGQARTLSDFRGKVLTLAFLDPACTDVCPLTAFHFQMVQRRLGERGEDAAFLAVNVNARANVAVGTQRWGMEGLTGWHFLTGSREELEPVWKAYYVEAEAGPKPWKPDEQAHTPGVYVIDQAGRLRWYISVPFQVPFRGGADGAIWQGLPLAEVLHDRVLELLDRPAPSS